MNEDRTLGDFTATRRLVPLSLLAVLLGCVSTLLARALLAMIAFFTNLFYFHRLSFAASSPADHHLGPAAVFAPIVGALVIGLMARFGSERIRGHGIPEAIEAILLRGSRVQARVALLKPISAAISIGSGGPFGAEGPIVMTGGAVGSLVAQLFRLTNAERKTLLVAGAAAGMSATFAAPCAATLLAVELLLFEWKPRSFVPVALASATAAAVRPLLLGQGPVFHTPSHPGNVSPQIFAGCIAAGVLAGALSALLTKMVYAAEDTFAKLPLHWMWWPAIGGGVVGLGGLIYPRALGVGYDVIEDTLRGDMLPRALLLLVVVKATIWAVSLGSGTSGGVLAPLLMMGAALGGLVSPYLPVAGPGFWALVCMGAILGGTMRAPFTGVVFAVELTQDFRVLLPLLIAVTVAHGFTVLLLKRSILTEKISRRGFHLSREYATDPLEILFVREVMSGDVTVLPSNLSIDAVAASMKGEQPRSIFPIADDAGDLVGVARRADIEGWSPGAADASADRSLTTIATHAVTAFPDEPLRVVVNRMAQTGTTTILVVDRAAPRRIVGEVTLRDMLKARVQHVEEETRREGPIPLHVMVPRWLRGVPSRP